MISEGFESCLYIQLDIPTSLKTTLTALINDQFLQDFQRHDQITLSAPLTSSRIFSRLLILALPTELTDSPAITLSSARKKLLDFLSKYAPSSTTYIAILALSITPKNRKPWETALIELTLQKRIVFCDFEIPSILSLASLFELLLDHTRSVRIEELSQETTKTIEKTTALVYKALHEKSAAESVPFNMGSLLIQFNQQCGINAPVDWNNFSYNPQTALGTIICFSASRFGLAVTFEDFETQFLSHLAKFNPVHDPNLGLTDIFKAEIKHACAQLLLTLSQNLILKNLKTQDFISGCIMITFSEHKLALVASAGSHCLLLFPVQKDRLEDATHLIAKPKKLSNCPPLTLTSNVWSLEWVDLHEYDIWCLSDGATQIFSHNTSLIQEFLQSTSIPKTHSLHYLLKTLQSLKNAESAAAQTTGKESPLESDVTCLLLGQNPHISPQPTESAKQTNLKTITGPKIIK
jgi:hypothetical protein